MQSRRKIFSTEHWRRAILAAALAGTMMSGTASACERDPYEFKLPEETGAQAKAREKKTSDEQRVGVLFDREMRAFETATSIYVGQVVRQSPAGSVAGKWSPPRTVIRLAKAVKGTPNLRERELISEADAGGWCEDRGDGYAAYAPVGTTVVVFEGLPVTQRRPRGIDSLMASQIRTAPLLLVLMSLYGPELQ